MGKRVLVTGGAGFVGSHLCEELLKRGDQVLCVDNFSRGRRENLHALLEHPCFQVLHHDITFPLYTEVDEIYHLADRPCHPIEETKTHVSGTLNILNLAHKVQAKVLYGSSDCAKESRRCAERLFLDYNALHGLQTQICQLPALYGPRMCEKTLVCSLIRCALSSKPLLLANGGNEQCSLAFVGECAQGLVELMRGNSCCSVHTACGETISHYALARLIKELTGSSSEIQLQPEGAKSCAPCKAASCNFARLISVREGLQETINRL